MGMRIDEHVKNLKKYSGTAVLQCCRTEINGRTAEPQHGSTTVLS